MQFGIDTDDISQERASIPPHEMTKAEKQKILKYDPDLHSEDGELPKTTDIDELYDMREDDPEVVQHQMARKWREKPRKDLHDQFKKNYTALSAYWKELYAKEA